MSQIEEVQSEYSLISGESGSQRIDKIEKQKRLEELFFPADTSERKSNGDDSSLIKRFKFFDIDYYEMVEDKGIKNSFEMIDYDV